MQRLELLKAGKTSRGDSPVVAKKSPTVARAASRERALEGALVPRKVSRMSNQRREDRHHGVAGSVLVTWEKRETEAKVINVSERGLMIEGSIAPSIGEKIEISFEGCDPLTAAVIWRKGHRVGLDLGRPSIDLFPEG